MNIRNLVLAAAALLLPIHAFALPAPMSEAELMEASELVVDAEVIDVVCVSTETGPAGSISTYEATLSPLVVYKGAPAPLTFGIQFQIGGGGSGTCGWSEAAHPKGQFGKHHLVTTAGGLYKNVSWNAFQADPTSKEEDLPLCATSSEESGEETGDESETGEETGGDELPMSQQDSDGIQDLCEEAVEAVNSVMSDPASQESMCEVSAGLFGAQSEEE